MIYLPGFEADTITPRERHPLPPSFEHLSALSVFSCYFSHLTNNEGQFGMCGGKSHLFHICWNYMHITIHKAEWEGSAFQNLSYHPVWWPTEVLGAATQQWGSRLHQTGCATPSSSGRRRLCSGSGHYRLSLSVSRTASSTLQQSSAD